MNDLRFAFRQLAQAPGFAAVAVLTLALGLTVNAVIFSISNDLFFRPLPATEPERLVVVAQKAPASEYQFPFSYADADDLRTMMERGVKRTGDAPRPFAGLMAYREQVVHLSQAGRGTERAWIHAATNNYFAVLGVRPQLGRFFLETEGRAPGADTIIVLTDDAWRGRFGADPTIIGQTVKLNGVPFTVIGVAPRGFWGASWGTALSGFVPVTMLTRLLPNGEYYALKRGNSSVFLMGRLAPGATVAQATAAIENAYAAVMKANPGYYVADSRAVLMRESQSRPTPFIAQYTPKVVAALSALALLVLFVAAANLANLLHARSVARSRELAIRSAIGASRFMLIRGLVLESAVLALFAGAVGVMAAVWLTPALLAVIPQPPSAAPAAVTGGDWRPFVATVLLALGAGIAAGIVPALKASGTEPLGFLKQSGERMERHFWRRVLVVGQVTVSSVILVCAGLALRSLVLLARTDLGFHAENVVVASFDLGMQNYAPDQGRKFHAKLLERVRALPGVESASLVVGAPLEAGISLMGGITAVGAPKPAGDVTAPVGYIVAEHAYLATIGLRVEAGRDFSSRDDFGAPRVVLINRVLAEQLWPGKNPVGQRISIQSNDEAEVIGVIGRTRYYSMTDERRPLLIDALAQNYRGNASLVVRTAGSPATMGAAVVSIVSDLDPDLPVFGIRSLKGQIADSPSGLMPFRLGAWLAGAQASIALFLAGAGIFGLISFAVARRTREIGIRIALGASRGNIARAVAWETLVLTSIGLMAGLTAAFGLSRLLGSLLYDGGSSSIFVYAAVGVAVLLTATLACAVPARHALHVNPVDALRAE
jgi:predicted permease